MARTLVDLRDVQSFMATTTRPGTPIEQQRANLIRFYLWLCRNSATEFDLILVCPHCNLQKGRCRCPQMGYLWDSPTDGRTWTYEIEPYAIIQWRLDRQSLLSIDSACFDKSSALDRRLMQLIAYLTRV